MNSNNQTTIEKSKLSVSLVFIITFIVTLIFTAIVINICIESYVRTLTGPGLFGITPQTNFTKYMYLYAGLPALIFAFFFVRKYIAYTGKLTKQYFRSLTVGYSISFGLIALLYLVYGPSQEAMFDLYPVIFFILGAIVTSILNKVFYSKMNV
jgi:hypothetical protein